MELIKVSKDEQGELVVSGRELHEFLEVATVYPNWIKRQLEVGFIEGEDFIPFLEESNGGRPSEGHALKLDTAKHIAMIQRSEKGMEVRKYFIEVEKQAKNFAPITDPMEMMKLHYEAIKQQSEKIEHVKNELDELKDSLPLLPAECQKLSGAVKRRGVNLLGGKLSPAYGDKSLRARVYTAVYQKLKMEFEVGTYKEIKRKHLDICLEKVDTMPLPYVLETEVEKANRQLRVAV